MIQIDAADRGPKYLFGAHSSFQDQSGDVLKERCGTAKVFPLFAECQNARLLVVFRQELNFGNRISEVMAILQSMVEHGLHAGELAIDCRRS